MKTVQMLGYNFDCLPGHVSISARGAGTSLRAALHRGISKMFTDPRLKHKRIGDFKISVVVIGDAKKESI